MLGMFLFTSYTNQKPDLSIFKRHDSLGITGVATSASNKHLSHGHEHRGKSRIFSPSRHCARCLRSIMRLEELDAFRNNLMLEQRDTRDRLQVIFSGLFILLFSG